MFTAVVRGTTLVLAPGDTLLFRTVGVSVSSGVGLPELPAVALLPIKLPLPKAGAGV